MVSLRIRALALVAEEPGLTSKQIADRLGESIHQTCAVLHRAAEDGELRRAGKGTSGRGAYLYWPLEAPVTPEERIRRELGEALEQLEHYRDLLARAYRHLPFDSPVADDIAKEIRLRDLVEAQ